MSLVYVCKSTFSPLQYVHTAGKSSLNLAFFSPWCEPIIDAIDLKSANYFLFFILFCLILFQIRPKPQLDLWSYFMTLCLSHYTHFFLPHWKLVEEGLSRSDDAVPRNRRLVDEAGWKPLERKQNCIHFVTIVSLSSAQQPKNSYADVDMSRIHVYFLKRKVLLVMSHWLKVATFIRKDCIFFFFMYLLFAW